MVNLAHFAACAVMAFITLLAVSMLAYLYFENQRKSISLCQAKRLFDSAYVRLMREIENFNNYWRDIWGPEYLAQPLKIDHEVKQ